MGRALLLVAFVATTGENNNGNNNNNNNNNDNDDGDLNCCYPWLTQEEAQENYYFLNYGRRRLEDDDDDGYDSDAYASQCDCDCRVPGTSGKPSWTSSLDRVGRRLGEEPAAADAGVAYADAAAESTDAVAVGVASDGYGGGQSHPYTCYGSRNVRLQFDMSGVYDCGRAVEENLARAVDIFLNMGVTQYWECVETNQEDSEDQQSGSQDQQSGQQSGSQDQQSGSQGSGSQDQQSGDQQSGSAENNSGSQDDNSQRRRLWGSSYSPVQVSATISDLTDDMIIYLANKINSGSLQSKSCQLMQNRAWRQERRETLENQYNNDNDNGNDNNNGNNNNNNDSGGNNSNESRDSREEMSSACSTISFSSFDKFEVNYNGYPIESPDTSLPDEFILNDDGTYSSVGKEAAGGHVAAIVGGIAVAAALAGVIGCYFWYKQTKSAGYSNIKIAKREGNSVAPPGSTTFGGHHQGLPSPTYASGPPPRQTAGSALSPCDPGRSPGSSLYLTSHSPGTSHHYHIHSSTTPAIRHHSRRP